MSNAHFEFYNMTLMFNTLQNRGTNIYYYFQDNTKRIERKKKREEDHSTFFSFSFSHLSAVAEVTASLVSVNTVSTHPSTRTSPEINQQKHYFKDYFYYLAFCFQSENLKLYGLSCQAKYIVVQFWIC